MFWSLARTTRSVVESTFCFVDVALLIVTSVELWMNGVPRPAAKRRSESGAFLK